MGSIVDHKRRIEGIHITKQVPFKILVTPQIRLHFGIPTYMIPSGYAKIAIENCPVDIVRFPINGMVIFHSYVNVYQII